LNNNYQKMNKKYSKLTLFALTIGAVLFMSNRGGSPGGRTGSTTDGSTCGTGSGCHNSANTQVIAQDMISSDIPETGYAAGATYTLTVNPKKAGTSVWGFEMMAEDAAGAGVNTKDNGLRATHKFATTASADEQSWSMEWTAPATGTGDIRFYAASLAANGNATAGGDDVVIDTLFVSENATASIADLTETAIELYPNPASNFINISGYGNSNASLSVFNKLGAEVMSVPFAKQIDISNLPKGAYHLKIVNGDMAVTKNFLVL
jgi:hypothetical protein